MKIVTGCLIALCGLTGPFCLVLLPLAVAAHWFQRESRHRAVIVILAVCVFVQTWALVTTAASERSHAPLGASASGLLTIVAGRVYLAALLGKFALVAQRSVALLIPVAVIASTILVYCFQRCALELRLLITFCSATFSASLLNPMVSLTTPQWSVLSTLPGIHYWFLPTLAFVWSLLWCFSLAKAKSIKRLSTALVALMCLGIARDWNYPRYKNEHFAAQAARFAAAPIGTIVEIPIFPDGWVLRLKKQVNRN